MENVRGAVFFQAVGDRVVEGRAPGNNPGGICMPTTRLERRRFESGCGHFVFALTVIWSFCRYVCLLSSMEIALPSLKCACVV